MDRASYTVILRSVFLVNSLILLKLQKGKRIIIKGGRMSLIIRDFSKYLSVIFRDLWRSLSTGTGCSIEAEESPSLEIFQTLGTWL